MRIDLFHGDPCAMTFRDVKICKQEVTTIVCLRSFSLRFYWSIRYVPGINIQPTPYLQYYQNLLAVLRMWNIYHVGNCSDSVNYSCLQNLRHSFVTYVFISRITKGRAINRITTNPFSGRMSTKTLSPKIGSGSGWGTWFTFGIRSILWCIA